MVHLAISFDPLYYEDQLESVLAKSDEASDDIETREEREANFVDEFILKVGKRDKA